MMKFRKALKSMRVNKDIIRRKSWPKDESISLEDDGDDLGEHLMFNHPYSWPLENELSGSLIDETEIGQIDKEADDWIIQTNSQVIE